jgi:protein deglycase
MNVLVPLAEGFEETEAITVIDLLRRAKIPVTTVFLKSNPVTGRSQIKVLADKDFSSVSPDEFTAIYLPGGAGADKLNTHERVISFVQRIFAKGGVVSALCAAPKVLAHAGIMDGKNATCFPGTEKEMPSVNITRAPYILDGNILTGLALGTSVSFGLKLVELLAGRETMLKVKESVYFTDDSLI